MTRLTQILDFAEECSTCAGFIPIQAQNATFRRRLVPSSELYAVKIPAGRYRCRNASCRHLRQSAKVQAAQKNPEETNCNGCTLSHAPQIPRNHDHVREE